MSQSKIYFLLKVLAFFGILLSVYLLYQQIFRPTFQPCYVNSIINCDAVISGAVAKTFGISTPLIGLIGYITIMIAILKKYQRILLGAALFGLIFCLGIAYIELFQLKVICPVCIGCQFIMISIALLSIKLNLNRSKSEKA